MNQDFDEQVTDSMKWFTEGVDVPSGFAARAREHVRRQRRTRLGWVATGTAVAAAAAVVAGAVGASGPGVGASGPGGGASGPGGGVAPRHPVAKGGPSRPVGKGVTIQTTSVVISRVDRALAKTAAGKPVAYTRETSTGARLVVLVPHSGPVEFSPNLVTETWSRGGVSKSNFVTPSGQVLFSTQRSVSAGKSVDTSISYQHRAWWRGTYAAPAAPSPALACTLGETDLTKAQWTREIKKLFSCGAAHVAGYQQVDGVKAVKLKLSSSYKKACAASNYQSKCTPVSVGWSGVIWADASTYLPVRLVAHGHKFSFQIDFQWLAPTAANLASLQPKIPAGFRHV
jgi:hypothetical protein